MWRIVVDLKDIGFYKSNSKNAASKPRTDVEKICSQNGFSIITIYSHFFAKTPKGIWELFLKKLNALGIILQSLRLVFLRDSIILVQYPFLNHRMQDIVQYLKKRNKIVVLYHDLYNLRIGSNNSFENWLIRNSDVNIVHSESMKIALEKQGCKTPMVILQFFDYLNTYKQKKEIGKGIVNLVFAGNLTKSGFVRDMNSLEVHSDFRILLYGLPEPHIDNKDLIYYKGVFENETIDHVEGNWGLVWDGDTINGCAGNYGEYLKINAPFKFSLYLAMGIPVVVWSNSAMAQYVEDYHLGIVVDSITEIYERIKSLSEDEIEDIRYGVQHYSSEVKQGKMLGRVLQEVYNILNK